MRGALCPLKPQGPSSPGGPTFGVNLRGAGGLPAGVGVSPSFLFPLARCRRQRAKREKKVFRRHPYYLSPRQGARQGAAAPWNPALGSFS
jgi:hypothetical protein